MADSDNNDGAVEAVSKAADAIERLSSYTFALHILPAFLAVDICLLFGFGSNVLTTKWSELSRETLGVGICAVVGYLVFMAIAVPVAQWVMKPILTKCWGWLEALLEAFAKALVPQSDNVQELPKEIRVSGKRVWLSVVRDRALRDRDGFWLPLVHDREARAATSQQTEMALAKLSFATVVLALVDVIGYPGASILGVAVQHITAVLGTQSQDAAYLVVASALCAVALPWLADVFVERDKTIWIEHPALADEMMGEFSKRQEEQRRQMGQVLPRR